jgi:hypothetical protein
VAVRSAGGPIRWRSDHPPGDAAGAMRSAGERQSHLGLPLLQEPQGTAPWWGCKACGQVGRRIKPRPAQFWHLDIVSRLLTCELTAASRLLRMQRRGSGEKESQCRQRGKTAVSVFAENNNLP